MEDEEDEEDEEWSSVAWGTEGEAGRSPRESVDSARDTFMSVRGEAAARDGDAGEGCSILARARASRDLGEGGAWAGAEEGGGAELADVDKR
jgi:hypothetical protein